MKQNYQLLKMADGESIRVGIFTPDVPSKGVIQLVHGFGEYIGHYLGLIDFFIAQDYTCVMHDQRGHGEQAAQHPKTRGIAPDYHRLIEDVLEVRQVIAKQFPKQAVYLMGHSMGDNIVLNLLLETQKENQKLYQKAIVESPWLDLAHPPAKIAQMTANLLGKISPKIRVHTGLNVAAIAHDAKTVKLVTKDGFYHDFLSLRLFSQIKTAGQKVQAKASQLEIPTLLLCAEKDEIVSAPAIRAFAKSAKNNLKFLEIPDGFHALHLDNQAPFVMAQMLEFLNENLISHSPKTP